MPVVHFTMSEYMKPENHEYYDYCGSGRKGGGEKCWDLGVNYREAKERAVKGDLSIVARSQAMIDGYNLISAAGNVTRWDPAVVGQKVSVPDYLSGSPTAMRRRHKKPSQVLHVGIYAFLQSSAGVDANDLMKRGSVILALLQSLQARQVSVDLYLVCDIDAGSWGSQSCQVIQLESRPLDLSVSSFAIAHPSFVRNLMYAWARKNHGFRGGWSGVFETHNSYGKSYENYVEAMRPIIGAASTDIVIPPVFYQDPIISEPEEWLKYRLHQLFGQDYV